MIQIYVNLNIDESLAHEIVKDQRYYKKDSFNKALQKAGNERYTSVSTLENFENLISSLSKISNEEEDDEEVFG